MCQQVLLCPEIQMTFRYVFPFLIVLTLASAILLISESIKTYKFLYPEPKISTQFALQTPYSLLTQAQEIAEEAEKQLLEKEKSVPEKLASITAES